MITVGDGTDGKLSKAEGGDKNNEEEQETGIGILENMLDNLDQFVLEPSPQGCVVKCRITRDRKGMDRGKSLLHSTFHLRLLCYYLYFARFHSDNLRLAFSLKLILYDPIPFLRFLQNGVLILSSMN